MEFRKRESAERGVEPAEPNQRFSLYRHCGFNGVEFGGKGRLRAATSKRVHEMRVRVVTVTAPKARGSSSVNFSPTPTNALAESNRLKSHFTEPCLDRFELDELDEILDTSLACCADHLHHPPSPTSISFPSFDTGLGDSALSPSALGIASYRRHTASPPHSTFRLFHIITSATFHLARLSIATLCSQPLAPLIAFKASRHLGRTLSQHLFLA